MRRWIVLVVVTALCSACSTPGRPSTTVPPASPAGYEVTYRVVGSRGVQAAIHFTSADGTVEQVADAPLNWSHTQTVAPGTELSVTVQSLDQSLVTCSIEIGGFPISKSTGGRGGLVACSGRTP